MLTLIILPVLILTWIATDNTFKSVEKEIIDANITRVDWAGQYLDELIFQFDYLFYSLQIDEDVLVLIESSNNSSNNRNVQKIRTLQDKLKSAFYSNSRIIDELNLYFNSTGQEISVDSVRSGHISYPDIRIDKWAAINNGPISLRILENSGSIYALHSINAFIDRSLLGGMSVRINKDVILYVMDILRGKGFGDVLILNDKRELLSGSPKTVLSEEYMKRLDSISNKETETDVYKNAGNIIFTKVLDRGRLIIIKTIPEDLIAISSKRIIVAGMLTSGILILVSVLLSVLFSSRISKPIIHLAQTMEKTTLADFKELKVDSKDEIGTLIQGYNTLMSGMANMVEKEYQSEIDLRNARLNALHAQINPHFLYNTLQLIGGMALTKNAPEIYKVTRAVGNLFRYTTGTEGKLVSVDKEISHIRNYLIIQELRFKGRCKVTIEIEDRIKNTPIPQFTLQPIIENAFEHGLQPKVGKWTVKIRGIKQKKGIILKLEDNGLGMSRDNLLSQRELLSQKAIQKNSADSHIGLKNVDTRLKLHFGEKYGLRLFSSPGKGTKIILILPDTIKEL